MCVHVCVTGCVVVKEQLLKAGGWEKEAPFLKLLTFFAVHVRFLSNRPKLQLLGLELGCKADCVFVWQTVF